MRLPPLLLSIALVTGAAAAQTLDCPGSSGARCDTFHFHVQMYRPDTRGFAEVWGTNQFASQSSCERARDATMRRNLAVVDHMKRVAKDNNFEPDRFGQQTTQSGVSRPGRRAVKRGQRDAL